MNKGNGYYDFDLDIETLFADGNLDAYFWYQDIKQRKFMLNDNVEQYTVWNICRHILQINKEDAGIPKEDRKPILVYIATNGGEVDSGFELIDCIRQSITPVYTVVLCNAYSMGSLIAVAGQKRYAMPNSTYLIHDGSNFVYGTSSKVRDQVEFQCRVDDKVKNYIIEQTKITPEEYDSKLRQEWYMFADEAKEKGCVDYIIGVDVAMDAIV